MNLSRFPTITVSKTIIVEYPNQNLKSQTFFDYDNTIDKSKLKGLRIEYSANSGQIGSAPTPPTSLNYLATNFFPVTGNLQYVADPIVCSLFGITLVDTNNNLILQNYPLNGLNNPTYGLFGTPNTNYIRRFNADINLSKSYISLLDKTFVFAPNVYFYFAFTFYIKPKK